MLLFWQSLQRVTVISFYSLECKLSHQRDPHCKSVLFFKLRCAFFWHTATLSFANYLQSHNLILQRLWVGVNRCFKIQHFKKATPHLSILIQIIKSWTFDRQLLSFRLPWFGFSNQCKATLRYKQTCFFCVQGAWLCMVRAQRAQTRSVNYTQRGKWFPLEGYSRFVFYWAEKADFPEFISQQNSLVRFRESLSTFVLRSLVWVAEKTDRLGCGKGSTPAKPPRLLRRQCFCWKPIWACFSLRG